MVAVHRLSRPLKQQAGQQVAEPTTRPAPIGGWNSRDPKDQMPSQDALRLINWFPRQRDIVSRPGYTDHCSLGTGAAVRRLMPFEYGASLKLLASSGGKIFDASTSTPTQLATGLSSDYYASCQLGGRLFMANGVDNLKVYDGSTVADSTFTGVSLSLLTYVHVHKRRFYAIQKNSQIFWYGSPSAISGALSSFDLGTANKFGGNLMLLTTISVTGGQSVQDYFVAIFTSGDVVVYSGTDPGDASNWAEVGIFKIGRPLSRFGVLSVGNDVIVITDKGYESLRVSIPNGIAFGRNKQLSDKIQQAVTEAINNVGASDDWSMEIWPIGQMEIIQLPVGAPEDQHVRNFNTGAWCEFSGLNACSWGRFGSKFMMGTRDGKIKWFGSLSSDAGTPIRCDVITAWDAFGHPATVKQHTLQRLEIETLRLNPVYLSMGVDFQEPNVGAPVTITQNTEVSIWDEAEWDNAYWSSEVTTFSPWVKCPTPPGRYSCMRLVLDVDAFEASIDAITYLWIPGGLI